MKILTKNSLQIGQKIAGFEIKDIVLLEQLQIVAYKIEHLKTGAKILKLHNDDSENLFTINFLTPPPDNTGVAHILEHSVLGGSQKYPIRDAVFELLKISPATFVNAMTGNDYTCYFVSSKIERDLFNLAEVYFDAVFHPLLTETTFKREGHHLAPSNPNNLNDGLKINGIVYNEMKGAFSNPKNLISNFVTSYLLPDTIYAKESGGDPEFIPNLTYKNFREFHQTYYHPSNTYFFCYGNISPQEYLEFLAPRLDTFDKKQITHSIFRQPRWSKPRSIEKSYPIGKQESEREKTYLLLNWLTGDSTNADEWIALYVLNKILLGNEAAPLKKAILDARIGLDVLPESGINAIGREIVFSIGIKGSEINKANQFTKLIESTLEQIAAESIPSNLIEGAFQQATYYYQEFSRMYPLRLMLGVRVLTSWIYEGEPLHFLNMKEQIEKCQQNYVADPDLFNNLIREKLLNNSHRLTLILKPDREVQQEKEQILKERLEKISSQLSQSELIKIAEDAKALQTETKEGNSGKNIPNLPQLKLTDLPQKPEHIPTVVTELPGELKLLRNQIFSNGINYLEIDFPLQGLPQELWVYLSVYIETLQKLGAAEKNYEQIANGIAASTGGLKFECKFQTHAENRDRSLNSLRVSLKTLDNRLEEALNLLRDILFAVDFSDRQRLSDIIVQTHAKFSSKLLYDGMTTARLRAEAGLTLQGYLKELVNGLPLLKLTKKLSSSFDRFAGDLTNKLEMIRNFIGSQTFTASFTGSDAAYEMVKNTLTSWGPRDALLISSSNLDFTRSPLILEGLAGPTQVAYCVQSYLAPHYSELNSSFLTLAVHLLSLDYLIDRIRRQGGAYGAGCRYNCFEGTLSFYSYRDPHISRTLEVFDKTANYLRNVEWRQEDIERTIIATTQKDSPILRPELATSLALDRYLRGETEQIRENRYESIFKANAKEVRQIFLNLLEQENNSKAISVMSSREKIELANREMTEYVLTIQDILA